MKKILLLMFVLILLSSFASAIKINYYHYKINQDDCRLVLESIPERYYEGIRYIDFYIIDNNDYIDGYYIPYLNIIRTFDNCSLTTLIHELAHHKNYIDGIHSSHGVGFKIAQREIWQNLN